MAHTKGKWVAMGSKNEGYDIASQETHEIIAGVESDVKDCEANAQFIVRACNCHEELLRVLKRIVDKVGLPADEWKMATDIISEAEGKE